MSDPMPGNTGQQEIQTHVPGLTRYCKRDSHPNTGGDCQSKSNAYIKWLPKLRDIGSEI
jgi:hypothetical protein